MNGSVFYAVPVLQNKTIYTITGDIQCFYLFIYRSGNMRTRKEIESIIGHKFKERNSLKRRLLSPFRDNGISMSGEFWETLCLTYCGISLFKEYPSALNRFN